ncbi:hypothetical protein CIY_04800 [Butyrivibrio fibrisolvens 16/4]|nr:hypothetical protein CIY_04800 [Butyrivibrio fibrisolvens 16/4]
MTMVTDTYKNIVLLDFFKELFDKNNCNNLGKESRAILLRWMSDRYEKIGDFYFLIDMLECHYRWIWKIINSGLHTNVCMI